MSNSKLTCPKCRTAFRATVDRTTTQLTCPNCGKILKVKRGGGEHSTGKSAQPAARIDPATERAKNAEERGATADPDDAAYRLMPEEPATRIVDPLFGTVSAAAVDNDLSSTGSEATGQIPATTARLSGQSAEQSSQAAIVGSSDRRRCYLCKRLSPGDLCEFWAGFCVHRVETDWGDEVKIDAKYRDLHRYSVTVCDTCAAGLRKKHHLPKVIGWAFVPIACVIGAAVLAFTQVFGDSTNYLLGLLFLLAIVAGMRAVLDIWWMCRRKWSPPLTSAVLEKVKKDPEFQERGDSFFSPEEYRALFPDTPDEPLTAEEILARDRTGEP